MAHFHKMANGERISGTKLGAPGGSVTVGLWGYLGFNGSELKVQADNGKIKVAKGAISGNSRQWSLSGAAGEKAKVSALYSDEFGTHTWDWFDVEFSAGGGGGSGKNAAGKYTDSAFEQVTTSTKPSARDVVNMLLSVWPALNQTGARTLTSQFMAETGGGKHCYNWNLGNVKASANEPHMYLRGVWEVYGSPEAAEAASTKAAGKAHVATAEEIKKHGWGCPPGKAIVVYDPPHSQCRFRAYNNLQEGAQKWLRHHQNIANRDSEYINTLNGGDTAAVAKALKKVGYYTASESDYARGMANWKKIIDKELGS